MVLVGVFACTITFINDCTSTIRRARSVSSSGREGAVFTVLSLFGHKAERDALGPVTVCLITSLCLVI